jgi:tripartite-type tricarboxylate transporter receptor subunit TctC
LKRRRVKYIIRWLLDHPLSRMMTAVMLAAFAATLPMAASAQNWPTKPITLVVPFPPGPAVDLVARFVGGKLSEAFGQSVVIENRTGANGMIGASLVARAAPDGYTLLTATAGTHVTAVHLMKNLSYDPVKDFTPIAAAVEPVTCLVVHRALPVNSVAELVVYAKARPGELSYGSSGVGSVFHLMGELFNSRAGVKINHVPYRGVSPALQDVVAGHIPMAFLSLSNALATEQGSIKILAVLEPKRFDKRPEIASMSESLPAFNKPSSWFGFFGPAGMPAPIVTRLNGEIVKALSAPDVLPKLGEQGLAVIGGTPQDFAALLADGIARYGEIIKAAGVQPE